MGAAIIVWTPYLSNVTSLFLDLGQKMQFTSRNKWNWVFCYK